MVDADNLTSFSTKIKKKKKTPFKVHVILLINYTDCWTCEARL